MKNGYKASDKETVKQVDFLLIFLRYHYNFILFCLKIKYIFYIM